MQPARTWLPCAAGAHDALTLLSDRIAPGAVLLFDEVRCSAGAPVSYRSSCPPGLPMRPRLHRVWNRKVNTYM